MKKNSPESIDQIHRKRNANNKFNGESPCKIISKYFLTCPVMDESLTEFQEKKTTKTGPKKIQKPSTSKTGSNKTKKRIKGQKDIRNALESKKNDLLTYAKKFDEVCKQSGVDIDSEQLQLAVALSKSLQNNISENCGSHCPLNSKDRTTRIRTTLQEYGFTIPEIKINSNKRLLKQKRNYKLLSSTAIEKQQIISDKYSQILFEIANKNNSLDTEPRDYSDKKLYYVSTSIPYSELQSNDILYVENLLDKSRSTGNLLRDWSDIPGRPASPEESKSFNMNFSEIECSQDELDVILSGTLKAAKEVVKKNITLVTEPTLIAGNDQTDNDCKALRKINGFKNLEDDFSDIDKTLRSCILSKSCNNFQRSAISEAGRSCSPDLFDDEESVLDASKDNRDKIYSQLITSINEDQNSPSNTTGAQFIDNSVDNLRRKNFTHVSEIKETDSALPDFNTQDNTNVTKRISDDFMEVTSCIKTNLDFKSSNGGLTAKSNLFSSESQTAFQLLHTTIERTKRKSNDFMEITECVPNHLNVRYDLPNKIDLTQKSEEENFSVSDDNISRIQQELYIKANIDLTQKSDDNDDIVDDEECKNYIAPTSEQLSTEDDLPFIQISGNNDKSLDDSNDTIIFNEVEIHDVLNNSTKPVEMALQNIGTPNEKSFKAYDLTKTSLDYNLKNDSSKASQSFFDEFVHDHSDDTLEDRTTIKNDNEDNNIDLTQSSDSTVIDDAISLNKSEHVIVNKSSLGKKDDVFIDYDDLYDDVLQKSSTNSSVNNVSQQSYVYDANGENNKVHIKTSETSTQSSGVFEICDQELNYSLDKSRHDYVWDNCGGLSVLDSTAGEQICRNAHSDLENNYVEVTCTTNESFLPMVDMKSSKVDKIVQSSSDTPVKSLTKVKSTAAETPNNEYDIKTDQITPMLDYASMSSPERNRELDKYGLKPFKRKRAIQLLTHLYNQTHPIVELCSEGQPSPSKKRKHNQPSPKKCSKSMNTTPINGDKENLYQVTKDQPDIRSVECLEEDWIFQKREKAKLHSCRVPLHIAFHNYVSCRQRLREAILRYEPVNIDVIHKDLVSQGHRYDPKDLLKFMDKKCITVKTTDNMARNKKQC